jgi:DNA-binding transcriptional ArsR family regulator
LRERGSSALKAGMDTVITLKADGDGVKMECAKQRTSAPFETRFINWVYTDNPNNANGPKSRVVQESTKGTKVDLQRPSPNDKKILQQLGAKLNVVSGLRYSELLEALGDMPKSSMNNSLKKLAQAGWVQGGDKHPYKITNSGLEIIGFEAGDVSDY